VGEQPAIQAERIGKRFGDVHALAEVSLRVPAGTVVGVLGPNGAGKTTLVRILTTLLPPDSGRAGWQAWTWSGRQVRCGG
jgi:ABC-2 type transport system ATP-binding protein